MENTYGFRLQEINHNTDMCSSRDLCDDTATSVSSYSNTFKQRIDAMFDDSRSILSEMSRNDRKNTSFTSKVETYKERVITNNIQEKIEKMFKEISQNGNQKTNNSQKCPSPTPLTDPVINRDFKVIYLGSKPLPDKNVSLTSLQTPLKELYFEYNELRCKDNINNLRISRQGLNIKGPTKEELHPFSTIAVWAAVKLAFRGTTKTTEYAFLPLIKDPDGIDKNLLFKELKKENQQELPQHLFRKFENHSPIFTVVMKNVNANKQLECHGFICESSEEAIVIAANLYQALIKKLKRRKDQKEEKINDNSSTENLFVSLDKTKQKPNVKLKNPAPPIPARPPRKPKPPPEKKNESLNESQESVENNTSKSENAIEKLEEKEDMLGSGFQRRGSVPANIFSVEVEGSRTLRRTVSDRGSHGITVKEKCDTGDILTKVAIPRSQSFLNANGPLTRFSRRTKTNTHNEIISPLGFKELFNEFKVQEGLENMDDILNAIIDAEGMSFNDLKPIYKEFLLKLAMTLTKDEMYQRSKIIMRRQRKRNRRCNFRKRPFMSTMGLNKVFKKTACKLGKTKHSKPTNFEFTSVVFQPTTKQFESKSQKNKVRAYGNKKRSNTRRRLIKRLGKAKNCSMTSEESIFYLRKNIEGPNRSSSGYFSCSECSYDSENCTCISADKCYCTLGHKKKYITTSSDDSGFTPKIKSDLSTHKNKLEIENSVKSCSCDTESCPDSTKCYCNHKNIEHFDSNGNTGICQTPHLHPTRRHNPNCPIYIKTVCKKPKDSIFDQLKEQGFISSESTLSRAGSPAWELDEDTTRRTGYLRKPKRHNSCMLNVEDHHLREIQNTTNHFEDFRFRFENNNQINMTRGGSYCGRRPYSSMRCREEFLRDLTNSELFHRSASCRKKHIFSSVRSKRGYDSFMNQIKFPNACSNNNSLRFTKRIDVYNIFSEGVLGPSENLSHLNYKENWKKFVNQRAIRTDSQRLGCNSNKQFLRLNQNEMRSSKTEILNSGANKKKILVVSARDPRGKVVYMGASTRGEHMVKNPEGLDGTCANASEALAVKKSAEIAALFSDMSVKQKMIRTDSKIENIEKRSKSFKSANLENGLGYLP